MEIDIQARRIHVINVRWFLWTLVIPVLIKVVKNGPGYLKSLICGILSKLVQGVPPPSLGLVVLTKKNPEVPVSSLIIRSSYVI